MFHLTRYSSSAVVRASFDPSVMAPFILTLELDLNSFEILNALRKEHFPPERNFLDAHITLFHKLPGEKEEALSTTLETLAVSTRVFDVTFSSLRFLGRGVAINVESTELLELRQTLRQTWLHYLETQDQGSFKPHVTIQNKVASQEAKALLEGLSPSWQSFMGKGIGLLLWRYLGGPWELVKKYSFLKN
ncbi:MAG: 2'-5' RNA ligase family protein [Trueperaceae bacterium]